MMGPPDASSEEAANQLPARPLGLAGVVAAGWCAGVGLAVLLTVTLIGWVAFPHGGLGQGLPGVFRTTVQFWLVVHHVGFAVRGMRVDLLPLALPLLPGLLLYRAGRWAVREAQVARLRHVGLVATAIAAPYSLLAGVLALLARNELTVPSIAQALLASFLIALVASGAGAARAIGPWRELPRLLPERPRSLVVGTVAALAVLLGAGALVTLGAVVLHWQRVAQLTDALNPGWPGGIVLAVLQLLYLPNVVIWGMAYAAGPGFAVGAGTTVAPTGVQLGAIPSLPILAAIPEPGPAPWVAAMLLIGPFLAGALGGVLLIRTMPTPTLEAAPLWGFGCGLTTGVLAGALAICSGGSLGGQRLTAMGPSGWQVGLSAALEVGVAAGIAAWITNWLVLRNAVKAAPQPPPEARNLHVVADPSDDHVRHLSAEEANPF